MNGAAAEHIREGIPVLASYCDALGVRAFAEGKDLRSDMHETLVPDDRRAVRQTDDQPGIRDESSLPGAGRLAHAR